MARSSPSRFRNRNAGSRRRVSWSIGPSGTSATLSVSGTALFAIGAQAVADDLTIVRLRGRLMLQLETAASENSGFEYAFGITVVSSNAFDVGVTAVPEPLTDIAWDGWFVHGTGVLLARNATPQLEDGPNVVKDLVIDSKAMRKTHATDVIVAAIQVVEITPDASMRAYLTSRVLSKLP